ncbi:MAG: hypothetical protein D0530_04960 [Methylococcales bacterium]|nr:MAG: hypothetical protein D0530_04960 [Methylococcales bacterium]
MPRTKEQIRDKRILAKSKGLCYNCYKRPATASIYCSICGSTRNKIQKQRREKFLAQGLCPCGTKLDRVGSVCSSYLGKNNKRADLRVCRKIAAGLCSKCPSVLDQDKYRISLSVDYPLCSDCFFKSASYSYDATAEELRELFDQQNGCCAYTGEKLILGQTAWVDHIVPKYSGGSDGISNLQWVTKVANQMKRNYSHNEFVRICKLIASRF